MLIKGLFFIIVIVLSGISLILCGIFFIIRLSENHPKKWNWLYALLFSLALLVGSIFLFVRKVVMKVSQATETFVQQIEESAQAMDSLSDMNYALLDSANMNAVIKQLKIYEDKNKNVPPEFYVYNGFRDYYRMPLPYPYALHCIDVLETASLFNEKDVTEFNSSDNGEIDCNVNGITAFSFDENLLVAKQQKNGSDPERFIVYRFGDGGISGFRTLKEALSAAKKEFSYHGPDTLATVLQYHDLFK